nr:peptidoglycan-binding protein [Streptomyces sp. NBC_00974]
MRPYVSLPDLGQAADPPMQAHTPAYGTPVAPWPAPAAPPAAPPAADETIQLRPVPAYAAPPRRRTRLLLVTASAVIVSGAVALALTAFSGSDDPEVTLLDGKPSDPVISLTQAAPSQSSASAKPSPSPSRSASPSRSPSPSATPSATPSRSSAPAATPTPSRPSSPPPAPQAPVLRYGDSGPEVEDLQRRLAAQGVYSGKIDGKYGSRTENAVSTFQWQNEIEGDDWGVYGPETRRVLEG